MTLCATIRRPQLWSHEVTGNVQFWKGTFTKTTKYCEFKMKWQNCLKAMGKTFHPECFACAYCGKIFANSPFYLEDGLPYCEDDWNELFTTKCINCGFPIEAGDRWVEALNNNYHSQCFNCTLCKKNLEGKRFFVKAGKPFCKSHASRGWTSAANWAIIKLFKTINIYWTHCTISN